VTHWLADMPGEGGFSLASMTS